MTQKYKLEVWKKTKWTGTKREQQGTQEVLQKRYKAGTIINGKKMGGKFAGKTIKEIKTKCYGSGVYKIGIDKGKIITRKQILSYTNKGLFKKEYNKEWEEAKKEAIKGRIIFRCAIKLNDIPSTRPTGKNEYYGFSIWAFSHSKILLNSIYPDKMRREIN